MSGHLPTQGVGSLVGVCRSWTEGCISCEEKCPTGECSAKQSTCGHHCNHSWSHDRCCWCGAEFGEQ